MKQLSFLVQIVLILLMIVLSVSLNATADVNTVATNIADVNNFADTYFTGATAPSTPTLGDLWFYTTVDKMLVYTAFGWQDAGHTVASSKIVLDLALSDPLIAGIRR